jgi:hypothetical protein
MRIQDAIAAVNQMEAFVESGALNAARFQDIIVRHGPHAAWEKFSRRFCGDTR